MQASGGEPRTVPRSGTGAWVIRPRDYSQFKSTLKIPSLKIKYIFQERPLGTARATECACDFLKNKGFLLCWCDFLSPFDFRKIIREHLRFRPAATVLINKEKYYSGTAQVQFSGPYIRKIVEKPKRRFSFWGSTGILVLEPEILSVLSKINPPTEREYHIPDALQYLINQGKKVRYLKIDTWRINVNTLEDLGEAEAKVLRYQNPEG